MWMCAYTYVYISIHISMYIYVYLYLYLYISIYVYNKLPPASAGLNELTEDLPGLDGKKKDRSTREYIYIYMYISMYISVLYLYLCLYLYLYHKLPPALAGLHELTEDLPSLDGKKRTVRRARRRASRRDR